MLDVVITNPIAPSNLSASTGAVARAQSRKNAKYKVALEAEGLAFKPFAIDAFGGMGSDAAEVVERLAVYSVGHSPEELFQLNSKLECRTSCL